MSGIGIVKTVVGGVKAIALDGTERLLKIGDSVALNEKVITELGGTVSIGFTTGEVINLAGETSVTLTDVSISELAQETVDENEVAAIQAALENDSDFDPSALPATAAGELEAGGNEGSTHVHVDYQKPQVTPENGFDTKGINFAFDEPQDELLLSNNEKPSIILGSSSDSASEFTMINNDEVSSAGYHNSYGYYVKTLDAEGNVISNNPTTGVIVEDDVHLGHGGFTGALTVTGYSQEQLGYFIIPNGDGRNGSLSDGTDVVFKYTDGSGAEVPLGTAGAQWQAFSDNGSTPLQGNGSHVLFDAATLNKDGQDHLQDNSLIGNQNWEDLQIPNGDGDFNDVNTNVDWTKVTVSGDVVDSVSLGTGGLASIDFSFDSSDISISGILKSNGEDISFQARDTDSDGFNDQIVGSTSAGDVLTIDGVLDGEYDVNVLAPIDDGTGDASVGIGALVQATDAVGGVGSALLAININVDMNQVLVEA